MCVCVCVCVCGAGGGGGGGRGGGGGLQHPLHLRSRITSMPPAQGNGVAQGCLSLQDFVGGPSRHCIGIL